MKLSKINVLQRQIDTAIRMFFFDDDMISAHTLAGSGRNISIDLLNKRGLMTDLHSIIKVGKISEFENIIRDAQNFFKHADRDHDKLIDFNHATTPYLLLDATSNFFS